MRIHTYTAAETGLLVNSYLLETDQGVVAIDTNLLNSDIAALKARLAALKKPLLATPTCNRRACGIGPEG